MSPAIYLRLCCLIPAWLAGPVLAQETPPAFSVMWGEEGSGPGQFREPTDIDSDASGNLYVVDYRNNRVQKFTPDGWVHHQVGVERHRSRRGEPSLAPRGGRERERLGGRALQ